MTVRFATERERQQIERHRKALARLARNERSARKRQALKPKPRAKAA